MKVIVLQGIPGSGKSTLAASMRLPFGEDFDEKCIVFSADYWHMVNGKYTYKLERAGYAHGRCLRGFAEVLATPIDAQLLIIDNTNTTVADVAPYMALAQAYGCDAHILRVPCNWEVAAARTIHEMQPMAVKLLQERLDKFDSQAPGWWKLKIHGQDGNE